MDGAEERERNSGRHRVRDAGASAEGSMTEEEIIQGIAAGGRARGRALHALYHGIGRRMRQSFISSGVSRAEAADILQETVIKIFRHHQSYSDRGGARAWMWRIAHNCLVDHHRWRVQSSEFVDIEDFIDTLTQPDAIEFSATLEDCVEGGVMAFADEYPDHQQALVLRIEGASIEEIAAKIGRTPGATREFLSQCRKKIEPFLRCCREYLSV
jgi:RNA polymerase sigma factor (sigma-70 family)